MKLTDLTVKRFMDELSSSSPAPGGGSVAALCGALGAALCRMVSNLTIGKKKHADAETVMRDIEKRSQIICSQLLKLVDEDTDSYTRVVDAFQLPKDTPEQVKARGDAIQDALKAASDVPFRTLEQSAAAMPLIQAAISRGNPNCITDAGVAAELILTAARGAAYNVCINLMDIRDQAFVSDLKEKTARILTSVQTDTRAARHLLENTINLELPDK